MTEKAKEEAVRAMQTALEMNGVVRVDDQTVERILIDFTGWYEQYQRQTKEV